MYFDHHMALWLILPRTVLHPEDPHETIIIGNDQPSSDIGLVGYASESYRKRPEG